MNVNRIKRLVQYSIRKFELDLSGLNVLTEAATGYYSLTPIIAAVAGAKKVFALTKDSKYGTTSEVVEMTENLVHHFELDGSIEILFDRHDSKVSSADIVTNLGFVRPIKKELLLQLKETVVIPLMWETWEYRPGDLDIEMCRQMGIPALGTNERHPDLRTMEFVGHIALKLLYSMDIEVLLSKIVILGSGEFASEVLKKLKSVGADVCIISPDKNGKLDSELLFDSIKDVDAMVIAEHHHRNTLIGIEGEISPKVIYQHNPALCIAHISGGVNQKSVEDAGLRIIPNKIAPPGYMSIGTDYVGPKPLIDLHTAGLKVGQLMSEARTKESLSGFEAEMSVIFKNKIAQGFEGYHYSMTL